MAGSIENNAALYKKKAFMFHHHHRLISLKLQATHSTLLAASLYKSVFTQMKKNQVVIYILTSSRYLHITPEFLKKNIFLYGTYPVLYTGYTTEI